MDQVITSIKGYAVVLVYYKLGLNFVSLCFGVW